MFEASRPFLFFDYFRVPYEVVDDQGAYWVRARSTGRRLSWPAHDASMLPAAPRTLDGIPIHCEVMPDWAAAGRLGPGWSAAEWILDAEGRHVASVWRGAEGDVFLPFDPGEAIVDYWSERYRDQPAGRLARKIALGSYYRLRPALPRALQIRARRLFSRAQSRRQFPRWPVEPALHDLYDFLFRLSAGLAGEPVPSLAPWPGGYRWALVLTHDVETADGCAALPAVRDVEERAGYRSSWNFVPRRYDVDRGLLDDLRADGFEIGVHGLYHDGRDLASERTLRERLPAMREAGERWGATGFRSPATHRDWRLMPLLGFDYDSSYPDTDPYEPTPGGCCTWLPFTNGDLVELPITMPQDHTLFVILGHRDESLWVDKAAYLRARGGMALVLTHPDYMGDEQVRSAYARLLERFAHDPSAWKALPRDVTAWWRRRAASGLVRNGRGWQVTGPAAGEAVVTYTA
jgi:hypothetical protein